MRAGRLANGLSYFILPSAAEGRRATIQLVVRAGAVDEGDDERGFAHLLEHLAFLHGSAAALAELQSLGGQLGPHLNATTFLDYTTYRLTVPTDRDGVIGRALEGLRDIATGLAVNDEAIAREQRIVEEERRLSQRRVDLLDQERVVQALVDGSPYATRGVLAASASPATLASLRRFHGRHYRPDRMAVVIVGGIGSTSMEAVIRAVFTDLAIAEPSPPRRAPDLPSQAATRFLSTEGGASVVSIQHRRPSGRTRTQGDVRATVISQLAIAALQTRLNLLAEGGSAAFLSARLVASSLTAASDIVSISVAPANDDIEGALRGVLLETARASRYGFSMTELGGARTSVLARFAPPALTNLAAADRIAWHYVRDEPALEVQALRAWVAQVLPTITAQEVTTATRGLWSEADRVILVTTRTGVTPLPESAVRRAAASPAGETLKPWQPPRAVASVVASLPPAGRVRARRDLPDSGLTVLTLSNGIDVWLRPMPRTTSQVAFQAYASGGALSASPSRFTATAISGTLIRAAGFGGRTPQEWTRLRAGRLVEVSPHVGLSTHGVTGVAGSAALESALEAVHLAFTAPTRDQSALGRVKALLVQSTRLQEQQPAYSLRTRVVDLNVSGDRRFAPVRSEDIASIDVAAAVEEYQRLFANAADFTFAFSGDFTVEGITPLLQRYLGSLPSTGSRSRPVAPDVPLFPAERTEATTPGAPGTTGTAVVTFFADTSLALEQVETVTAAAGILERRLFDLLRTELAATYAVRVQYSDLRPRAGYGTVTVEFSAAPARVRELVTRVFAEIDRLRDVGPTATEIAASIERRLRDLEQREARSEYWVEQLLDAHMLQRDPATIRARSSLVRDTLTADSVRRGFGTYFDPARSTVVLQLPGPQAR